MDAAFSHGKLLDDLEPRDVGYTVSAPFGRFADLKAAVERRHRWRRASRDVDFLELCWKPAGWNRRRRLVVVRLGSSAPQGAAAAKRVRALAVALLHEGRGG